MLHHLGPGKAFWPTIFPILTCLTDSINLCVLFTGLSKMIVRGVRGRACSIWSSRSPSQGRRLLPPLLSRSIASVPSSSVNEEEVRKFGGYGSSWWDQASRKGAGPLHSMNPVRVEYLVNRVGSLRGVSVLDVGCGGGILSESLARMGAIVTGIDPSVHNIDVARQHAGVDPLTRGICYEKATAEEMLGKSAWPDFLPTRLCVCQLISCA